MQIHSFKLVQLVSLFYFTSLGNSNSQLIFKDLLCKKYITTFLLIQVCHLERDQRLSR